VAEGYRIDRVVTHLSAIGCYFFDPEGNRTEVFWLTGRPSWIVISIPIDIHRPDPEVLADIDRLWEKTRHVQVGAEPDAAAVAALVAGPALAVAATTPQSAATNASTVYFFMGVPLLFGDCRASALTSTAAPG
jgi:hypothetical protein